MPSEKRLAELKNEVAEARSARSEATSRRAGLDSNSMETAQQALRDKVDELLAAPSVLDKDIRDLGDLEYDFQERVTEERAVQGTEKDATARQQGFAGRFFRSGAE